MKISRLSLLTMLMVFVISGCVAATDDPSELTPSDTPTELPIETPTETPTDQPTESPIILQTDSPTELPAYIPTETPYEEIDNHDDEGISVLKDEDFDINYNGIVINKHSPFSEIADELGIIFDLEDRYKEDFYIEYILSVDSYHWFAAHYPSRENKEMTIEYVIDENLQESWLVSVYLYSVETYRGIKVVSTADDFMEIYGDDTWKTSTSLHNTSNRMFYIFSPEYGIDEKYVDSEIWVAVDFDDNIVLSIDHEFRT